MSPLVPFLNQVSSGGYTVESKTCEMTRLMHLATLMWLQAYLIYPMVQWNIVFGHILWLEFTRWKHIDLGYCKIRQTAWLQFSSTHPTSLCPDGVMQVLTWIYSISYKVGPSVALCWEWNPFTVINADGGALVDCTHLKDQDGKRPKECFCHGRLHILTSCLINCWQRKQYIIEFITNTHLSMG